MASKAVAIRYQGPRLAGRWRLIPTTTATAELQAKPAEPTAAICSVLGSRK